MPPPSRPYFRSTIEDLEKLFERSRANFATLADLRDELLQRDTPRAKTLLGAIQPLLKPPNLEREDQEETINPQSPQARAAKIKIAELRQRLLDLSNKNKLINFKHAARGGKQVRIVSEWLPALLDMLVGQKFAELVPLPPLPTESKDEQCAEFEDAVESAMLTDKPYINAVKAANRGSEDKLEHELARAERALKDKVRKQLGWKSRSTLAEISVPEHARQNEINPSYDLSEYPRVRRGRRENQWQTLLFEDELDRRLRAIAQQAKEAREEYGIDTLYLAGGFLEWREKSVDGLVETPIFSPLILIPVDIEKNERDQSRRNARGTLLLDDSRTRQRQPNKDYYELSRGSDDITVNLCLRQRLKQDFDLELPEWTEDSTIESYLTSVEIAVAGNDGWKVRNWATLSHLSFSRLAMWIDLDPDKPGIRPPHFHPVLSELLGGKESSERERDEPSDDTEAGVPCVIMDCDSSQFGTIREALKGRNLTVQGPPGTGKSQTIANLIAALLYEGKSVLFVAEKMAALDVVQSRLTQAGLGDFLLELHSAKAGKSAFLQSLKKRVNKRRGHNGFADDVASRRIVARDKLNNYAKAMNTPFGAGGMTVHDIIWRHFSFYNRPIPDALAGLRLLESEAWRPDDVRERRDALVNHTDLYQRHLSENVNGEHPWNWVTNPDLYVEERQLLLSNVLTAISQLDSLQEWLEEARFALMPSTFTALRTLITELATLGQRPNAKSRALWDFSAASNAEERAATILCAMGKQAATKAAIESVASKLHADSIRALEQLSSLETLFTMLELGPDRKTDIERTRERRSKNDDSLAKLSGAHKALKALASTISIEEPYNSEKLIAAATYIELISTVPSCLIAKSHLLGDDGGTLVVRHTIAEMDRCEVASTEFNARITKPVPLLKLEEVSAHRKELERGGIFAWLRGEWRAAKRFCKVTMPEVPARDRLNLLMGLEENVTWRKQLEFDASATTYAQDLFKGWSTDRANLVAACDWIDLVRQRTPIRESRWAAGVRKGLARISQDEVDYGKELARQGWASVFRSLAERCEAARVPSSGLSKIIQIEQDNLLALDSCIAEIGWIGTIDETTIVVTKIAVADRAQAEQALAADPEVTNLFLPDAHATTENMRVLAAMHRRIKSLPIPEVVREALARSDSVESWDQLGEKMEELARRLRDTEGVLTQIQETAVGGNGAELPFSNMLLQSAASTFRRAVEAEAALTTRSLNLSSAARLRELGLMELYRNAVGPNMKRFTGVAELFDCIYLRSLASKAIDAHPILQEFRRASPSGVKNRFKELDEKLKALHMEELVDRLLSRHAPTGISAGLVREKTEMGLLNYIAGLENPPRTSIPSIMSRAAAALKTIKPCFLMSPLSVAQLIQREKVSFDVVIFDEASQVRPEDALCALARGRQFVVVGDLMQLPPTTFGEKTVQQELIEDDNGEPEEPASVESILELACATYGEGTKLLWHYRSRDPELIAFSNAEFYKRELKLFPCPQSSSPATGIKYVWIGGTYSARTNADEAKACAQAALEFMRTSPTKSLGIVALNRPQADLIELELKRITGEDHDAVAYRAKWKDTLEPLFVKNLENVQGDERDVMFVSTVFGRDDNNNFYQRFGPINSSVGHRRLNVLFTRAKHQLVVFTSLPTEKIAVTETSHRGVRALRDYLDFARTKVLDRGTATGRGFDSPFEEAVSDALMRAGYDTEPQVGVAGFFVDLAVKHPRFKDSYMLGLECDGAAYHGSVAARDRDRLRQAVLESFGWKIYRIWSTDWFADPIGQLKKLVDHLEEIKPHLPHGHGEPAVDFERRFSKPRIIEAPVEAMQPKS